MSSRVIAIVMGGGRGTRLWPLTRDRCKPAVPLAGMCRLVDIPISNCLHSSINEIYLLTQFNTASLHRHVREAYKFDPFGGGFVELLAAEQTEQREGWYQGTADAVRANLVHFRARPDDLVLILSGDQLYRMDYRKILGQHIETKACVTVAATPIPAEEASAFGLMHVDEDLSIREFVEKPKDPATIERLHIPSSLRANLKDRGDGDLVLASMGIYVFSASVLLEALDSDHTDFGHEVIPGLLDGGGLHSHVFDGYWEDIGTVAAFFDANLRLTDPVPPFNFFDPDRPIFTRARYLPCAKVNQCDVRRSLISGGVVLSAATVDRSVIGIRSFVQPEAELKDVVMMGADRFETDEDRAENRRLGRPDIGIGEGSRIERAIIDVNARIGRNVHLSPEGKPDDFEEGPIVVRDGVLIVTKNGVVPDGTTC